MARLTPTLAVMETTLAQIVIGIVSGILTAGFLYLVGLFFFRIFVPWYQRKIYAGISLSGTWEYRHNDPGDFGSMVLQLSQNAHNLKGVASVTVRIDKAETNIIFSAFGSVWEGYVSLILKSKDSRMVHFGTLFLKVGGNGAVLVGVHAFKDPSTDRPSSTNLIFQRAA